MLHTTYFPTVLSTLLQQCHCDALAACALYSVTGILITRQSFNNGLQLIMDFKITDSPHHLTHQFQLLHTLYILTAPSARYYSCTVSTEPSS